MKLNYKITVSIMCAFVIFFASCGSVNKESKKGDDTSPTIVVDKDYTFDGKMKSLEVEDNKDFKILNITDIHLQVPNKDKYRPEPGPVMTRDISYNTITKLVNQVHPDLITVTGDSLWKYASEDTAKDYIKFMDSLNTFWAPIYGNHDGDEENCDYGSLTRTIISDLYKQSSEDGFCLYMDGPGNPDDYGTEDYMGQGNYIINIVNRKEDGTQSIRDSIIMMDTHNYGKDTGYIYNWYGVISKAQVQWYQNQLEILKNFEKKMPQSLLFMHLPLSEYQDAYNKWKESGFDGSIGSGATTKSDEGFEDVRIDCSKHNDGTPSNNNNIFNKVLELGSTKDIVCGHNHSSDFSILYKNVRLTFAVKTGMGCDRIEKINGGTVLTLKSDGKTEIERIIIPYSEVENSKYAS